MAAFETPEEKAAREAREAQQQQVDAYRPPGEVLPPPGKTSAEPRTQAMEDYYAHERNKQAVATGNRLPGGYSSWEGQNKQDIIFSNLTRGEAEAQRKRDFGFGSANNAETAAMIGQAQATGNKFSNVFGDISGTAGARSAAANDRGTAQFAGDTGQYQQGLANAQQSRGMQTGAYGALMNMANQGPGPSAAQAQLTQATDANTQNALAMARSGRGMGGGAAAMRQAVGQNAATQQSANSQMAELRANENTAFQNQRLQALNAAGGVAGQTVAADQGYGALGLQGAQYQTDTALKGTQLNDTTAQAWAAQQQAAAAQAQGAEQSAQTQAMNINAQALAGRESEHSAAFQKIALERGEVAAQQAAQANLVNAAISGGATVAAAVSDERAKVNIVPLGGPIAGNDIKPIQVAQPKVPPPMPAAPAGPNKEEREAEKAGKTGGTVGTVGGGVIGGAFGGPLGALAGSAIGGLAGKALGKVFSDVRSKSNVEPLSKAAGAYGDLQGLAEKYGSAGVAVDPKSVARYADQTPRQAAQARGERVQERFSRDDSHPILSEGDALLADSARNAPPSAYDYKDPSMPGAKPGRQVGPMAQDLAAHPVTRGIVDSDPNTGLLRVDGSRAATVGLAQNHSQQNQLDALGGEIARLENMLKRKGGDSKATSFRRDQTAGGLL